MLTKCLYMFDGDMRGFHKNCNTKYKKVFYIIKYGYFLNIGTRCNMQPLANRNSLYMMYMVIKEFQLVFRALIFLYETKVKCFH